MSAKSKAAKASENQAPPLEEKLTQLRADNAQAAREIAAHFGAERWEKIVKQCETQGLRVEDIDSLCGKMRRTRREWHPGNEAAALQDACNGLLCAIGSVPGAADEAALRAALTPAL